MFFIVVPFLCCGWQRCRDPELFVRDGGCTSRFGGIIWWWVWGTLAERKSFVEKAHKKQAPRRRTRQRKWSRTINQWRETTMADRKEI